MQFITGVYRNEIFIGFIPSFQPDVCIDLSKADEMMNGKETLPKSLLECIQKGDKFLEEVKEVEQWVRKEGNHVDYVYLLSDVNLLAPIPKPMKNIFCVGKNYREHAIEMGSVEDIPEHLMMFTKAPTSIIGHLEKVESHEELTSQLDYEGELAVVIGKKGRAIKEEEAYDYVFGYTILNDITARDLQSKHKQFFLGKSLDASCPLGPTIVWKGLIDDPHNLAIEVKVNGEIRQSSNTKEMIFTIPTIISTISKGMTLEPGDIIATGTPAGVGKGFKPPRFLKSGDVIEVSVEGIGTLKNTIS